MTKKLQEKLFKKYSKIFKQRKWPMTETCMCWGIETMDGWYWLLDRLCEQLQWDIDHNKYPQLEAVQVKEKFGCYDEKTEVLTEAGWRFFKDVSYEDKIACLEGDNLVYREPEDIISYFYDGSMYKLKTRGVDLCVTPNHDLYVSRPPIINGRYKPNKYKWFPFELTDYKKYFSKNKVFKKGAVWYGKEIKEIIVPGITYEANTSKYKRRYHIKKRVFESDKFLLLLGWYVAEGYYSKGNISLCLNHKNQPEIDSVFSLLKELNLKPRLCKNGIIRMYDVALGVFLRELCGHLSWNKKAPDFVKSLSPRQIKLFLETLYLGDGHKSKTAKILTTVSKQLADDTQELLLKAGFTSTVYPARNRIDLNKKIKSKHNIYEVNWLTKSIMHQTSDKGMAKSSEEKLVNYKGIVYCVSVPYRVIYVRRNGIPVWCGNSLRFYVHNSNERQEAMISFAEALSAHVCEKCGSMNNVKQSKGWINTRCVKCRKNNSTTSK